MKKIKNLTVLDYLNKRGNQSLNKRIRVLDNITHESRGSWADNALAQVKAVKITEKFLFIFI